MGLVVHRGGEWRQGRGRAWGWLEVPRHPLFLAHTSVPPCASLLAWVRPGGAAAAVRGYSPRRCGVAVARVPGASLRNWLFLMAEASSLVLGAGFVGGLVLFCFLPHGETPLTWGALPLPRQWVHWGLHTHPVPDLQCLGWGWHVAAGCWAHLVGCCLGGPRLGLPGRALPPGVCARGRPLCALFLGGTAPVCLGRLSMGVGSTCDHQA